MLSLVGRQVHWLEILPFRYSSRNSNLDSRAAVVRQREIYLIFDLSKYSVCFNGVEHQRQTWVPDQRVRHIDGPAVAFSTCGATAMRSGLTPMYHETVDPG